MPIRIRRMGLSAIWCTLALVCMLTPAFIRAGDLPAPFTEAELDKYIADWPTIMNSMADGRDPLTVLRKNGWDIERFFYIDDHVARAMSALASPTEASKAKQAELTKLLNLRHNYETSPGLTPEQRSGLIAGVDRQIAITNGSGPDHLVATAVPESELALVKAKKKLLDQALAKHKLQW